MRRQYLELSGATEVNFQHMLQITSSVAKRIALFLLYAPLPVALWFSATDARYSYVVNKYECSMKGCEADVDGDGVNGRLIFELPTAKPSQKSDIPDNTLAWVEVIDSDRELMRFPYRHIDVTSRTHVAIPDERGKARLLIFDRIRSEKTPLIWSVFMGRRKDEAGA